MKKRLRIIIPVLAIAVIGLIYVVFIRNGKYNGTLKLSGNIEVTEARLGFRIPGRLEKRLVDEGDTVKKGQVVATLESSDQKAALFKAMANYSYSKAVLDELKAGSRPEEVDRAYARSLQARYGLNELQKGSRSQDIERAKAALEQAEASAQSADAQLAQAKSDYERFAALYKDAGISQRDYELYKTKYETAKNTSQEAIAKVTNARESLSLSKEGPRKEEIQRAQASLKQAEADYALVKKGPRKENLDQAAAQLDAAKAALDQANLQMEYTQLIAPMDGIVLTKAAEVGEYMSPGSSVLVVGDLSHPWLRAYIHEKDLGRVKLNDPVRVTTDAFKDKAYKGHVSFISSEAEFTPKAVQTFEERVKLMFRIKIDLENPQGELKPGMPAVGVFICGDIRWFRFTELRPPFFVYQRAAGIPTQERGNEITHPDD
jgi:HlyD family secretion protein